MDRHEHLVAASDALAQSSEREDLDFDTTTRSQPQTLASSRAVQGFKFPIVQYAIKLWKRHVSMSVEHVACRDHLANERTFLGYLRTAQAFAILGVVIAQLMRLNHSLVPNPIVGFFVVSVPLACVCHIVAAIISVVGAVRFFKHQQEMARGYVISGGWEINLIALLSTVLIISLFVLALAIIIDQG